MRVAYSIGARFAGGGIGNTAYRAVQGLYRHSLLHQLLCGSFQPTEIPEDRINALGLPSRALRKLATYDPSRRITYLHNVLYDNWAARQLAPCDVFHGWGNHCLRTLGRAKALGAITVVERASSHPSYQIALLREEYARWGLRFQIPGKALERANSELEKAGYVLIPSDFVRQSFLEQGFHSDRLLEVPFGVDIERFCPSAQPSPHPFRVLYVGQVSLQKGIPYLLDAWAALAWRNAELWVVGRRDPEIAPILAPYGAMHSVRWLGFVSDPVSLFQGADIFAFPSLQEGSALVTYEAMACGLPVVTTPNAGSVVRDGQEGCIVPIRDSTALAERLETLRRDDALRGQMGHAARRRSEQFTWKRYQATLSTVFGNLGS